MRPVSLLTLKNRIVTRYRLPPLSANTWPSTTELATEINASLQRFYALLMDCQGDDYFASYADVTTSAEVDVSSLPAGFMRALNVTWLRDTDDPVQLEQATARDARRSGLVAQSWDSIKPMWTPHGLAAIRWLPTPNAEYTVRFTYVKVPADLVDDTDTFDAGIGWEEWVINDVCAEALCPGEERDATQFAQARERMEIRIREQAPLRGDTTGGLLLDSGNNAVRMGSWELRDWLTREGY